ncbi:MAG: molybdopterin-dependent oxidoreductase [Pseudomonadota bacterium]
MTGSLRPDERRTFCRFCHANCAMIATVEEGRVTGVRGDPDDPMFGGYTCVKGRALAEAHNRDSRLRSSQKRREDGGFEAIAMDTALDEIADRLRDIIERHGPDAVAVYAGTYAFQNSAAMFVGQGFLKGLGSHQFYTSVTLDQPAKVYTTFRMGSWSGGLQGFSGADVAMFIGNNPVVSHYAPPGGLPPFSPSRRLRDAMEAGLKLIVIDPRTSDVARLADVHLPVAPGEDVPLLAAIINTILSEGLEDRAFVADHVADIDGFRTLLAPFTPEAVAERCGVDAADIRKAARLFAAGPRGAAVTGTGPEMSGQGTLVEWLVMSLNIVCGRFARAGEPAPVPRVFTANAPRRAAVDPPMRLWGEGFPASRFRGLTALGEEMPCNVLADEILTPGAGQVRALINIGGNPVNAFPDQDKIVRALGDLDLLVSMDVTMAATARRSDYILAPATCLERDDITNLSEWWYEIPYARYTRALIDPPGDLIDEWEMFWGLASRLDSEIRLASGPIPTDRKPDKTEVLDLISAGALVPPSAVRGDTPDGRAKIYGGAHPVVEAADGTKFDLMPDETAAELTAFLDAPAEPERPFRLVSRRTKHRFNSTGHDIASLRAKRRTNHIHIHPEDLAALGTVDQADIRIASAHGEIIGVARADDAVRRGTVSMAHGHGDPAPGTCERDAGASTNRLVSETEGYDPITGQSRQSAIPVALTPVAAD